MMSSGRDHESKALRVAMDGRSLASPALRGWDRYMIGLATELVKRRVALTLFYREGTPLYSAHVAQIGCEVVGLKSSTGLQWEQVTLPRALRRGHYDIYHAPAEHAVPLLSPCPTVLTIHSLTWHSYEHLVKSGQLPGTTSDYLGPESAWKDRLYWNMQVALAGHILTPSAFSREEIIRLLRVPANKVTVTPLGLPAQFLEPAKKESDLADPSIKPPYLLYVGGYERHKNVSGLLEVFSLVRKKSPGISLVLVGTKGVSAELLSQAERLGLQSGRDVFFLADLGEQLTALYDRAEMFVTLSWRESFGLPALEAMSRGLRVVG